MHQLGRIVYVYDAWNRLVEVRIDPAPGSEPPTDPEDIQIRARYGYNGLHWRIWRIADEDVDVDALPDVANLYYYDAMWRLLEERVRGDFGGGATWANTAPDSGDLLKLTQRFWCLHYIDDLIAWQTQSGSSPSGAINDGNSHGFNFVADCITCRAASAARARDHCRRAGATGPGSTRRPGCIA